MLVAQVLEVIRNKSQEIQLVDLHRHFLSANIASGQPSFIPSGLLPVLPLQPSPIPLSASLYPKSSTRCWSAEKEHWPALHTALSEAQHQLAQPCLSTADMPCPSWYWNLALVLRDLRIVL